MFRDECPEFLNIRLGCWCSNGNRVSRAVWILVTIFLQPFVMGTSLGLLKQKMCPRMTSDLNEAPYVAIVRDPQNKVVNSFGTEIRLNRPEHRKNLTTFGL